LGGSSPLRLSRFAALLGNFPLDRLWQLTGAEHVLNQQAALVQPAEQLVALPGKDSTSFLHRLAQPTARAWIANVVQRLEDGAALPLLADARFDPSITAILPPLTDAGGRASFISEGLLATPGQNSVAMQVLAPGRLRFDIQSQHGGLLVISENWMPGWQATVRRPGEEASSPTPVLRADVAFLGVPVGPGDSIVDVSYRPASVRVGLLISGALLALLALALAWRIWHGRAEGQAQGTARAGRKTAASLVVGIRWPAWAMLAVLLAAFGLRVFRLDYQELRGDETFGYLFSLMSFGDILRSTISLREPHPVASYFLEKMWLGLAGHSEFALRYVGVWFGVLSVALLYRLGRRLGFGMLTAILAAGLLAASPYAIWHSQDARMYAISLALTMGSTVLALEALARQRWPWWLAYVAVSWLALQTHYFAVFIILAQNAAVLLLALIAPDWRRRLGRWLASQVLLGLLYLPWLIVAAETLIGYRGNGDSPAFAAMLQRSLSVFAVGETLAVEQWSAMAVLAGILLAIGSLRLALAGPAARRALLWLALYLAVPLLVTWISALQRPIFNERYLIAAAPPFFLLAAAAVLGWGMERARPAAGHDSEQRHRRLSRMDSLLAWAAAAALGLLLFGVLGSLAGYYTDPAYSKTRSWRDLAAVLERYSSGLAPEQVRLAENFPDPTLWYYYDGPVERLVLPPAPHDADRTAQEVQAMVDAGVLRVVLPLEPASYWDDAGIAAEALARSYELLAETRVGNWPVQIYARPPAVWAQQDVPFANGLLLAQSAVPIRTPEPGDVVPVYLRWQGSPDLLGGSEKLTLQVLDATGRLVAQWDQPFGPEHLQSPDTAYPLQLPLILPPGSYQLIAALYDPAQEGAPRLLSAAGADAVELAILEVR
jgi:4-amino-4-deoxy-L-arabinose transferase-like glycosyltransferase